MHLRRFNTLTLAVVLSLSFISAPVMANPGNGNPGGNHGNSGNHGHAEHGNQGKADKKNVSDDVSVRLSYDRARSLAVNYGLTGYDSLPPGIAKNLARGKPLPPGIAKKMVPASMLGQLPSYPGYEWRIAGDDRSGIDCAQYCHCDGSD